MFKQLGERRRCLSSIHLHCGTVHMALSAAVIAWVGWGYNQDRTWQLLAAKAAARLQSNLQHHCELSSSTS